MSARSYTAVASTSIVGDAPPVGEVAEEIAELAESIVDDDKDCDLEGTITAKDVEKTGLQGRLRELLDRCRDVDVAVPKGTVEIVVLAIRNLNLEEQLLESDCTLGKKQQTLKIAQDAVLGAQHLALAKLEEAQYWRLQSEDAEERMVLARDTVEKA